MNNFKIINIMDESILTYLPNTKNLTLIFTFLCAMFSSTCHAQDDFGEVQVSFYSLLYSKTPTPSGPKTLFYYTFDILSFNETDTLLIDSVALKRKSDLSEIVCLPVNKKLNPEDCGCEMHWDSTTIAIPEWEYTVYYHNLSLNKKVIYNSYDNTTNIPKIALDTKKKDDKIYNMNGEEVSTLQSYHIYIKNGKKFIKE